MNCLKKGSSFLRGIVLAIMLFILEIPLISAQETGVISEAINIILGSSSSDLVVTRVAFFFLIFIFLFIALRKFFKSQDIGDDETQKYALVVALVISLISTRFIPEGILAGMGSVFWMFAVMIILYMLAGLVIKDKDGQFNWWRLGLALLAGLILFFMLGKTQWFSGTYLRGDLGELIRVPSYFLFNRFDDYWIWLILTGIGIGGLLTLISGIWGVFTGEESAKEKGEGSGLGWDIAKYIVISLVIIAISTALVYGGPGILSTIATFGGPFLSSLIFWIAGNMWWIILFFTIALLILLLIRIPSLKDFSFKKLQDLWGWGINEPKGELEIKFLKPENKEKIEGGSNYQIKWKASGGRGKEKLELFYSLKGKDDFKKIDDITQRKYLSKKMTYSWKVPEKASKDCLLMLRTAEDEPAIFYGNKFEITMPEKKLEITDIVIGGNLKPGFPETVRVQVNEDGATVKIKGIGVQRDPQSIVDNVVRRGYVDFEVTPKKGSSKMQLFAIASKKGLKDSDIFKKEFPIETTLTTWIQPPKRTWSVGEDLKISFGASKGIPPYNIQVQLSANEQNGDYVTILNKPLRYDGEISEVWKVEKLLPRKNYWLRAIVTDASTNTKTSIPIGPFEVVNKKVEPEDLPEGNIEPLQEPPQAPNKIDTLKERYKVAYQANQTALTKLREVMGAYIEEKNKIYKKMMSQVRDKSNIIRSYYADARGLSATDPKRLRLRKLTADRKREIDRLKKKAERELEDLKIAEKAAKTGSKKAYRKINDASIGKERRKLSETMTEMFAAAKELEEELGIDEAKRYIDAVVEGKV